MELENNLQNIREENNEELTKEHEHCPFPFGHTPYIQHFHESLIDKIFPLGLDKNKERFAKITALKIGHNVLYDLDKGEITEVNINSIHPCQEFIDKTKLIELMIYLLNNDVPGYPIGVKIGNEVYLLDGHHRACAQILLGRKTIKMHLIAINEDDEVLEKNPNR